MADNVKINIGDSGLSAVTKALKSSIEVYFGPGVSKEKVKSFFTDHTATLNNRPVKVPGRNIFKQYIEAREDKVKDIIRKSYSVRFSGGKLDTQLKTIAEEIKKDIADWVYANNLKPSNGSIWRSIKGDKPTGVFTGEMIEALEARIVREP